MTPIKGTPAYWKKIISEVLAMVKQLGLVANIFYDIELC